MNSILSIFTAVGCSCIAFHAANAQNIAVGQSGGWRVDYDPRASACIGSPKSLEGLFFFNYPAGLEMIFGSNRLSWVDHEKQYPVIVRTDGRGWQGQMLGYKGDSGVSGLRLNGLSDEFLEALGAASQYRVEVDGVTYGPFSLSGSSKTLTLLAECASRREAGSFEPSKPTELPFNELMEWSESDYGKTFSGQKWTAELQNQNNLDGTSNVYIKVGYDGEGSRTIKLEGAGAERSGFGYIGVFPMGDTAPSLVFASYTGGAHCCTEAIVVTRSGALTEIPLGQFDGDGFRVEDVNQDGIFEVPTADQRFLYSFTSYAGSLPPARILAMRQDEFVDVTKEAQYQPYLRSQYLKLQDSFSYSEATDGQIAGLFASAANVGMYPVVSSQFDQSVLNRKPDEMGRTCSAPICPKEREFSNLNDAIETKLKAWNYQLETALSEGSLSVFNKLASAKGYGPNDGNMEHSCSSVPLTFKLDDRKYATMSGYEMGCDFTQASSFGDEVLAIGLCSGEGESWWANYHIKPTVDGLRMSSWRFDLSEIASAQPETLPVCK